MEIEMSFCNTFSCPVFDKKNIFVIHTHAMSKFAISLAFELAGGEWFVRVCTGVIVSWRLLYR